MKHPTQEEIAQRLGISRATVSRVLRNVSGPKSSTAVRIIEVAREMGYRLPATEKSASRKGTAKQKGMVLGLLACMPDLRTPNSTEVMMRVLHGAIDAARERSLLLHVEYLSESAAEKIRVTADIPESLKTKQLAGVLIAGLAPASLVAAVAGQKPCVRIIIHDPGVRIDCVGQDDRAAVADIINGFQAAGHHKIGFCCDVPGTSFSLARFSGYVEALAQLGLPYNPAWAINIWEPVGDRLFEKVGEAVSAGVRAWICSHDDVGYTLIDFLQARGLRVPEDVSICGFDCLHVPHGMKPLTTIDWPFEDMAAAGIEMLLRRTNEPMRAIAQLQFSGRLVERETVGPAPVA